MKTISTKFIVGYYIYLPCTTSVKSINRKEFLFHFFVRFYLCVCVLMFA